MAFLELHFVTCFLFTPLQPTYRGGEGGRETGKSPAETQTPTSSQQKTAEVAVILSS